VGSNRTTQSISYCYKQKYGIKLSLVLGDYRTFLFLKVNSSSFKQNKQINIKNSDGRRRPDCKIYRAEVLDANVDDVLIRPLGQAFSAQIHVVLDQNLTLKEAYEITKNNAVGQKRLGHKKLL
jgi:hypothetical protein